MKAIGYVYVCSCVHAAIYLSTCMYVCVCMYVSIYHMYNVCVSAEDRKGGQEERIRREDRKRG